MRIMINQTNTGQGELCPSESIDDLFTEVWDRVGGQWSTIGEEHHRLVFWSGTPELGFSNTLHPNSRDWDELFSGHIRYLFEKSEPSAHYSKAEFAVLRYTADRERIKGTLYTIYLVNDND